MAKSIFKAFEKSKAEAWKSMLDPRKVSLVWMQDLLEVTFERYFSTASLLGTVDTCQAMVSRLEACDVDEVACLIDFGPSDEQVMASLHSVDRLREACGADARARAEADAINEFSESIL